MSMSRSLFPSEAEVIRLSERNVELLAPTKVSNEVSTVR